jgi:hypothetical protein
MVSSQQTESFSPTEAHVAAAPHLASIAADVYNSKDGAYSSVFRTTASSDRSDDYLNSVLSTMSSPFGDSNNGKVNPPDRNDNAIIAGDAPQAPAGNTAWDPYEALTLNLHPADSNPGLVNPPDRNDNAIISGEKPPSQQGNTAWDPYEALTLNLPPADSKAGPVNPPDRNDNAIIAGENPPSPPGNTAWDPYEALTLPLKQYNPDQSQK